jgi:hypothetical protein
MCNMKTYDGTKASTMLIVNFYSLNLSSMDPCCFFLFDRQTAKYDIKTGSGHYIYTGIKQLRLTRHVKLVKIEPE